MSPKIGRVLKRHRIWKDLTAKKLAEAADMSAAYLGLIEQGKHDPSVKTLAKLSKALGVPLWEIIKEAEEENNDA